MLEILPWLIAMVVLIGCSAFFSASEAALFSLRPMDRRVLKSGTRSQRSAATLLADPERLLSAVLFWNLVVNIAYFALASIIERRLATGSNLVWPLRIGALLLIIFFSEMLPKTLAVLIAKQLAAAMSLPLSVLVRLLDPIMPALRAVMVVSSRLVWPSFVPETTLSAVDLERAIELSTNDAKLIDQERVVLRNIVSLSDHRADEAMRPTTQLRTFQPPVSLTELDGQMTRSGYLFLTEQDSENIASSVRLQDLYSLHPKHLEATAEPVLYVPWCATIADVLTMLRNQDRDVAAVVNEWGKTIGAITMDDVMDVVFTDQPSRSRRLLNRDPIQMVYHGLWQANGLTNIRQLGAYFRVELPQSRSSTIGGLVHECLQRTPQPGDCCSWGPFDFEVVSNIEQELLINVRRGAAEDDA